MRDGPLSVPAGLVPPRAWPRVLPAALLVLLALSSDRSAAADWGADINPGAGPRLLEEIAPDLAAIVKAPADARPALVDAFVAARALAGIEATKRFRNPELHPLFLRLAQHPDWKVKHRALFALEYLGGEEALDLALGLLAHPERRLREKAAITCIKLWDGRTLPALVHERLQVEEDVHVRRCLEALARRGAKKLTVTRVYDEHLEKRADGLVVTPFLSGMNTARDVAPGFKAVVTSRQGGGSASKLPAADRWVYPTLGYGEEVVRGTSLQPFANLRSNGTVYHTGHDVGASLDGAGYYAPAEGIVKLVHAGSDMGTLIVVEHHLGNKSLVNAVLMHGGDTVFVEPGDRVTCGQLLGTMGMGYSIENGGHFAHLHFGMYPGAFSMTHNYGYKPVKAGLADWHDPETFLAGWTERSRPIVPEQPTLPGPHARITSLLDKGAYGKAYDEAVRLREDGEETGRVPALIALIEQAPENARTRAERLRAGGYPTEALRQLEDLATGCRGIPGAEGLAALAKAWAVEGAFRTEVKAEKALVAAEGKATRLKEADAVRALWTKWLAAYGETPVAARVRERLGPEASPR